MTNTWPHLTYFSLSINSLHLSLGFFGLEEGEYIRGNVLKRIIQQSSMTCLKIAKVKSGSVKIAAANVDVA